MTHRIPASTLRELAVAASADPRTVRRVLLGERVRGMADDRIRRALVERGMPVPIPDIGATSAA